MIEEGLNSALRVVHAWLSSNKLRLSTSKYKYMIFANKMTRNTTMNFVVLENDYFEEKLNFHEHIKSITDKAKKISNCELYSMNYIHASNSPWC